MCFTTTKDNSDAIYQQQLQAQQNTKKEADVAKKAGRLLFTEGENNGVKLNQSQGGSIRKIFGNG